jgi:hypothetical protein
MVTTPALEADTLLSPLSDLKLLVYEALSYY